MTGLRVSELARRGGVPPSTVRFYERHGLLSPARRAANGYRVFAESAVDELGFVARAKGIGLSLPDIAALAATRAAGECRPLQQRLRELLARRSGQAREQLAELAAGEGRRQAALARLAVCGDGLARCGPGCACEAALDAGQRQDPPPPGQFSEPGFRGLGPGAQSLREPGCRPPGHGDQCGPEQDFQEQYGPEQDADRLGMAACSLSPGELTARVRQWQAVAGAATSAERAGGTARLTLPADPATVAAAAAVCAAETVCCPGTSFRLDISPGQVTMTAQAPGLPGLLDLLAPPRPGPAT